MTIKKLQHCFTNPIQSKRLLKLGVPADSADCFFYLNTDDSDNPHILYKKLSEKQVDYDSPFSSIKALLYPCWSVGRLIEIYIIARELDTAYLPIERGEDMVKYLIQLYEEKVKDLDFSKLEE